MIASVGTFILQVFEQHIDMLGANWARRRMALYSPDYTGVALAELEEVVEANLDGLAAAGEDALPLLVDRMHGSEPMHVFAAAMALLRLGTSEARTAVEETFARASEKKLEVIRDAFAHGSSDQSKTFLRSQFVSAPHNVAIAAAEALAFTDAFTPTTEQIDLFIRSEDASVRAGTWRLAYYTRVSLAPERYAGGLLDEDEAVRRAALRAAAWNGSPVFSSYCRAFLPAPTPESLDALVMLAAVAPPQEYSFVESIAANKALGPERFRVVGAFGHPYFLDLLVSVLEGVDEEAIPAAARTFEKMTGAAVANGREARMAWRELAPRLANAQRICRGFDMSKPLDQYAFALLDRESTWEFCLRARLTTGWQGTAVALERFPQRG
jgi:hypothetical protein